MPAHHRKDRVGDFCVAHYLAKLNVVHLVGGYELEVRRLRLEDKRAEIVNGRCRGEIGARRESRRKCGGAPRLVEFWRRRQSYEKLQTGVGCFCGEPGKVCRAEIMFVLIPYFIRSGEESVA